MPNDPWMWFVGITGVVLTLLNVGDKLISFKKMANAPEEEQNSKIEALENRVKEIEDALSRHDEFFSNDKDRIDAVEKEIKQVNTIVIKSLQALTEHALNGNNTDQLHECSKEMNDYLINR